MIPPFDHPDVISGQGTIGLEIAADMPDVDTVLVPVSGGGLISGVAAAITALLPNAKVVGVEPELAGDAAESFRAGRRIPWTPAQTARTMADGLRTFSVGELPWAAHQHPGARHHHRHRGRDRRRHPPARSCRPGWSPSPAARSPPPRSCTTGTSCRGGKTVAVVSGGNIDPAVLRALLADA